MRPPYEFFMTVGFLFGLLAFVLIALLILLANKIRTRKKVPIKKKRKERKR